MARTKKGLELENRVLRRIIACYLPGALSAQVGYYKSSLKMIAEGKVDDPVETARETLGVANKRRK
jgi:hypothetical protein